MTFFEHQEKAQKKTFWLLCLFVFYAILMALLFSACLVPFMSGGGFVLAFAMTAGALLGGYFYRYSQLRQGGCSIAHMLNGRLIDSASKELNEKKLINILEELSLAAGMVVPQAYVLPNVKSMNACAAGYGTYDSVVIVTEGLLNELNREELQAVMAHEYSHIFNGDMRLNIKLASYLYALFVLTIPARALSKREVANVSLRPNKDVSEEFASVLTSFVLSVVLWLLGSVGMLFGRLLSLSVSRTREFYADAEAVKFTRNAPALVSALVKIKNGPGSKIKSSQSEALSHMFFADTFWENSSSWFSTHPKIEDRIKKLDPLFNLSELNQKNPLAPKYSKNQNQFVHHSTHSINPTMSAFVTKKPNDQKAELILGDFKMLSQDVRGAKALIYGLMFSAKSFELDDVLRFFKEKEDPVVYHLFEQYSERFAQIPTNQRLSLLNLALPRLKTMSEEQVRYFLQSSKHLIYLDERLSLFELVLQRLCARHLEPILPDWSEPQVKYRTFLSLEGQVQVFFSALSHASSESEDSKKQRYLSFQNRIISSRERLNLENCKAPAVMLVLDDFSHASPSLKSELVGAAHQMAQSDGAMNANEAALIGALSESIDFISGGLK